LENFHHVKQTASVLEYIQKFEELMSYMQMDYPGLNEAYFVSSFIAGLREGIKPYLIPHSPQTSSDTYWKAKELEKGILVKKSLLHSPSPLTKPSPTYSLPLPPKSFTTPQTTSQQKPTTQPNTNTDPAPQTIPIKAREPGKCWGCHEPWTLEHKFQCKF
jgi:hypothetical protein